MQSDIMRARFATAFSNKKAESYYCTLCGIGLSYKEGREASVGRKKVVEKWTNRRKSKRDNGQKKERYRELK